MSETTKIEENTEWLKSPLSERKFRLQPMQEILLRPYFGGKRRLKLFRTEYIIGSGDGADIRLEDPFLSPKHAVVHLEPNGAGYAIRDLDSRNGLFLNGVRLKSAPLPSQGSLRLGRSTISWTDEEDTDASSNDWVVADPAMKATIQGLKRMAKSPLPVLLLGETGTGKDVLARLLHQWGPNSLGPYVPVNGALTGGSLAESELFGHRKGAFTGAESPRLGALRSAHGGTLFLDEIADVPEAAQVKLLRALEGGEIKALGSDRADRSEFRLVAATSRDLERRIQDGRFRIDLYYRIAGYVVYVPPLRERPLDILAIAKKFSSERGFFLEKEAEGKLLSHRWPGNVRELRSCLERATVIARSQSASSLMSAHFDSLNSGITTSGNIENEKRPKTLEQVEKDCIEASLLRNGWSRSVSARELGIARSTLFEKMRKFGLRDAIESSSSE